MLSRVVYSLVCKKFVKFGPQRIQLYRCKQCKPTFSEEHEKLQGPLGDMRIPLNKAETILKLMLEGNVDPFHSENHRRRSKTIIDLLVLVLAGEKCERIMNAKVKGSAVKDVERMKFGDSCN